MNKFISISIAVLLFFPAASAQSKRYLYIDSSLLQNEVSYEELQPASETESSPVPDGEMNDSVYEETTTDTSLYLNGLSISADSVKQWRNTKEFAYMQHIDSLLKDKQDKEKNQSKQPAAGPGLLERILSSAVIQALLWILAGFFVLFIIYRLFLAEGAFRRESKSAGSNEAALPEERIGAETDFDALINQSLQYNNFRQAVRYQYLRTLHKLAGKEQLELAPDKSNYQYVRELKNTSLQNDFAALTLNYEYVWYGEFNLDQDIYRKIEAGFKNFDKKI